VTAVLDGDDPALDRDQEIGWQAKPSTGGVLRGGASPGPALAHGIARHSGHCRPEPRVGEGASGGLDSKSVVEALCWVGDHGHGRVRLVLAELLDGRVEHHDLPDAGGGDLLVAGHERPEMQLAYRASCEAAELEMYQAFGIGDLDGLTRDGVELLGDDRSRGYRLMLSFLIEPRSLGCVH